MKKTLVIGAVVMGAALALAAVLVRDAAEQAAKAAQTAEPEILTINYDAARQAAELIRQSEATLHHMQIMAEFKNRGLVYRHAGAHRVLPMPPMTEPDNHAAEKAAARAETERFLSEVFHARYYDMYPDGAL